LDGQIEGVERECRRSEGDEGMKGIKNMQNEFPFNLNISIATLMVWG
jgi:hypothetical protein